MPIWRSWSFWLGPICTAIYVVFLVAGVPYLIYQSVQDGFTKEESLVLIGGLFCVISLPLSFWLIWQHLRHFHRKNLQKPIIRILWMVPIYACNAWLSLVWPSTTIIMDSIRECYEAYVIYNFWMYIMEALCMEMDLLAVMNEKPQINHFFPFCCLRNWPMGTDFVYKCKHGILQYAFFQPIITVISVICDYFGVYGKGTISPSVAYPYLVVLTNVSQAVAMYCLVLFYRANYRDMSSMRPLPKFLCIKAVIFFSFFQGMVINILVYFKVIKNIFGTNENDDYQVLSEKLQNFLICVEMVLAALGHHYSYPYTEHTLNIPNYQTPGHGNYREMLGPLFDVNDISQDFREHAGAVINSLTRPFRTQKDTFQESRLLLSSDSNKAVVRSPREDHAAVAGPSSRYGTLNYVASDDAMIPKGAHPATSQYHHQGAPPRQSTVQFRGGTTHTTASRGDRAPRDQAGSSSTVSTSSSTTVTGGAVAKKSVRKSDSGNTSSWPSNSISSDVINIEVKGPEENLIQLPKSPPV